MCPKGHPLKNTLHGIAGGGEGSKLTCGHEIGDIIGLEDPKPAKVKIKT